MNSYELFVNQLTEHPSGNSTFSRVMYFSFRGEPELLNRIMQTANAEILKWHEEQKEKND